MSKSKLYYHFTTDKLRDGTKIPPIGEWLIYPKKPIICQQGLHASEHPFDALKYAPGNLLHLVELSGIETIQADKVVAKGRRIIATIDSTELLQRAARKFALDVIDLWNPPDIVREYLITGDRSKARASSEAATRAAQAASWATSRASSWAAQAASWAASEAASWAASQAAQAASEAAQAASEAASEATSEATSQAARAASWAASWATSRAASWAAQAASEAATQATRASSWAAQAASEAASRAAAVVIQREYFLEEVKKEFSHVDSQIS